MKMPPQKPVGNGYYGYEDLPHTPATNGDAASTPLEDNNVEQNSNNAENDFEEYLWMENEEEFDKQVMQQLEEEELMEQCLEAMLEEEQRSFNAEYANRTNLPNPDLMENGEITNLVENFKLELVDVTKSTLNPLAAEFVPDSHASSHSRSTE